MPGRIPLRGRCCCWGSGPGFGAGWSGRGPPEPEEYTRQSRGSQLRQVPRCVRFPAASRPRQVPRCALAAPRRFTVRWSPGGSSSPRRASPSATHARPATELAAAGLHAGIRQELQDQVPSGEHLSQTRRGTRCFPGALRPCGTGGTRRRRGARGFRGTRASATLAGIRGHSPPLAAIRRCEPRGGARQAARSGGNPPGRSKAMPRSRMET